MNTEEFVEAVRTVAVKPTGPGVIDRLGVVAGSQVLGHEQSSGAVVGARSCSSHGAHAAAMTKLGGSRVSTKHGLVDIAHPGVAPPS